MLRSYIGDRKSGFLFETESGKMLSPENLWRDGFATIDREMEREGVSFHAFRRFRTETLRRARVPEDLIGLWLGHAPRSVTDIYANGLQHDLAWRREWCDRVGLGFSIGLSRARNAASENLTLAV